MSLEHRQRDLQRLHTLFCQRERSAHEAVLEQQREVQRVEDRLTEQRALIAGIREQIALLHQLRSTGAAKALTAESLVMESTRRRWLTYDLEQEVFYLSGFKSDVQAAESTLQGLRGDLVRARARISGLDELLEQNGKQKRLIEARREDSRLDDLPQRECAHG